MIKKQPFSKYHGLGNDFIILDGMTHSIKLEDIRPIAKSICDRHTGIGADGIILALPSDHADLTMRVINADGSEPEMCGNGIRCIAKWAIDTNITSKKRFSIETLAGIKTPTIIHSTRSESVIEVDMGPAILEGKNIPVTNGTDNNIINKALEADGKIYHYTAVSMGNPHAVFFTKSIDSIIIRDIGPTLSKHSEFPNGANIEFAEILTPNDAVVKVWERGAGETLACGTGACAVAVAGILTKQLEPKCTIRLPGGPLHIEWQHHTNNVIMTGPATAIFHGDIGL